MIMPVNTTRGNSLRTYVIAIPEGDNTKHYEDIATGEGKNCRNESEAGDDLTALKLE